MRANIHVSFTFGSAASTSPRSPAWHFPSSVLAILAFHFYHHSDIMSFLDIAVL